MDSFGHFDFNSQILDCVVGGVSVLDIPRLNVSTHEEARQFIASYGYDVSEPDHLEQLWAIHRRAVALIRDQLLDEGEVIPERLFDPALLSDICDLLLFASSKKREDREMQRWACAILRVMHVFVHLRHDLFSAFRDEIQAQILKPLQEAIFHDEPSGVTVLGPLSSDGGVRLHKFEIKPFKTTTSAVVKLLARPERVALTLLDKLGVRFVTKTVYDSFRVIRFLVDSNLMSFPHIIPDQSNNTLFPLNLFREVMGELKASEAKGERFTSGQIEELLKARLQSERDRAQYFEKSNEFSADDYRFIKFISRKLIVIDVGSGGLQRRFGFFYPYEIQIMDHETYMRNLSGPSAHDKYKSRQRKKARDRVMGALEAERKSERKVNDGE